MAEKSGIKWTLANSAPSFFNKLSILIHVGVEVGGVARYDQELTQLSIKQDS